MPKRISTGVVVSDKEDKTIRVNVDRRVQHKKYKKIIKRSKKYSVHDETNKYKIGDNVMIEECKPYSKSKKWVVVNQKENTKNIDDKGDQL